MPLFELSASVLPTPLEKGEFKPPEKVFEVNKLDDRELSFLRGFVKGLIQTVTSNPNAETWDVHSEDMFRVFPWLRLWAQAADGFLLRHGHEFTPSVTPDDGFSLKLFINRASEDHMDLPRLRPAALSIGLEGTRELVGIIQANPEETIELARKLLMDGRQLREYEEIEGIPVERVVQRPGDVVTIGNFATLHSGFPLGASVALAVASRNKQAGPDPQYIVDHYTQFYSQSM